MGLCSERRSVIRESVLEYYSRAALRKLIMVMDFGMNDEYVRTELENIWVELNEFGGGVTFGSAKSAAK